eukprot:CAMPEP_0197190558 /NCGR_PEP_ID=MMETSP1423-20130617/21876_1 /TAXON_ID=476441 /ORGANISM="Pseudo-nitzschia heimii, Strain UNC1101" /LENGTH=158 /DNA_ID=CAMNT_0042642959 /DNA_START=69 /DNA_END=542 /DNA_ORIENTATION=+
MDDSLGKITVEPSTSGSTLSASASTSPSIVSSTSASSSNNYYQRRFDGRKRRTELLEKIARNSPGNRASTGRSDASDLDTTEAASQISRISTPENENEDDESNDKPKSPPKIRDSSKTAKTIPETSFSTPERKNSRQNEGIHEEGNPQNVLLQQDKQS